MMKHFTIILHLSILLCLSSVGYASSPADESVHFCTPFDSEEMRERYRASKRAYSLNVGQPRTVRMIYFLPKDRPFRQEVIDNMRVTIPKVQAFFGEQMQAHGYGYKTFHFETDAGGEPVVHRVDGQYPISHYASFQNDPGTVVDEVGLAFDISKNIYLIVLDTHQSQGGVGSRWNKNGGFAVVDDKFEWPWQLVAHELGHSFGLHHDFRDGGYIMSYGPRGWDQLSECAAEFLSVHPYLNPDIPIESEPSPVIKYISPRTYPADAKRVLIEIGVSDSEGIHQVILFMEPEEITLRDKNRRTVKAFRGLDGAKNVTVQFDYDGVIPSAHYPSYVRDISLLNPLVHNFNVMVTDTEGNTLWKSFKIFSESLSPLTKFSGDNQHGLPNLTLPDPFVVVLRDLDDGSWRQGVWVTFNITEGDGVLSEERVKTGYKGRAESILTLGPNLGTNTVVVSAAEIQETVAFSAVAGGAVSIPDPILRAAIEAALKKESGDQISPAEMATVRDLHKTNSGISDLTGLDLATNLEILYFAQNPVSDLSFLSGLTNLELLTISVIGGDLSPLAGLVSLTHLEIHDTSISDISPLLGLTSLVTLQIHDCSISDLSGLEKLKNLQNLYLDYNNISDISSLSGLTNLRDLDLAGNTISDISSLSGLTNLRGLGLFGNTISDISPLSGLTNLISLSVSQNIILEDISALSGLTNLKGLYLPLNNIEDISALSGLTNLETLYLYSNRINDISALSGLINLKDLELGNNIISDISALVDNEGLGDRDVIDVSANPLNDMQINHILALRDRGAVVLFDEAAKVHLVDSSDTAIYWTTAGNIWRVNLDGSNIQDLVTDLRRPFSLALDVSMGKMYWTELDVDKIRRANLDGSNVEDLVTGVPFPTGIALDTSGGKMYWVDNNEQKVQRANLDGSNVEDLVTGVPYPSAIALDVSEGKIYWEGGGLIQRANLDGTNIESSCSTTSYVNDIALDTAAGKVYWTDWARGEIFRGNYDATNVEEIIRGLTHPDGITVDVSKGKIYWVDRDRGSIQRANLDGTNIEDVVTGLKGPSAIALGPPRHSGTVSEVPTSDFDGDGTVGIPDFLLFAEQFGFSQGDVGYDARFDLDGDGVIGVSDFLIFVNNFGKKVS